MDVLISLRLLDYSYIMHFDMTASHTFIFLHTSTLNSVAPIYSPVSLKPISATKAINHFRANEYIKNIGYFARN
jgi:hypothetical protein